MDVNGRGKICVLTEWPLREGWESDLITRTLMREGVHVTDIVWVSLLTGRPYAGDFRKVSSEVLNERRVDCLAALSSACPSVVLSLGEHCLRLLTKREGIDKWQASVITSSGGTFKVIPSFSTERIARDLSLQLWLALAARKVASELKNPTQETERVFILNPPIDETIDLLRNHVGVAERISVDIETGRGQINTVGFAVGKSWAVAINTLPDRCGAVAFSELWRRITDILQSDQPKILQNFIYETLFFSRYGIHLNGVAHDTMIAQKFLWPEFEMGLDAVGRMYSEMPYWKEDGKSWNNIRDWERHYEYNCKDTCGTYEGYLGQRKDLEERGLTSLHDSYLRRLYPAVAEMCSWGIPVSKENLTRMQREVTGELTSLLGELRGVAGAESLNPKSPTQVKAFLKGKGYAIPKKYDSATKSRKESTDEKSLKKLRMKYPEDNSLSLLLKLAKLNKAQSSYLNFGYDADNRMRYSLTAGATETMRMAGYCDPWDRGVNPQTVPGGSKGLNIKSVFAAEPGFSFLQCDLKQAESRFVAYDSADANLIRTLEDSSRDIHKEVAAEIFGIPVSEVTKQQRQLGKKSGHGANYSMKEATFIDSCISEMDLVLSKTEANKVLEAYHKLFPGIRRWHEGIRRELAQTRKLATPWGWERHFFGRLDDDMFRQAYAFRPQSTIPFIVNQLMLHLVESRRLGSFDFRLLLQCHDSILLEVPDRFVPFLARECLSVSHWHPEIILPGGRLVIPTSVEVGRNWGDLSEYEEVS